MNNQRRKRIDELIIRLEGVKKDLELIKEEEEEYLDNTMGELEYALDSLQEAIERLEYALDSLQEATERLEDSKNQ